MFAMDFTISALSFYIGNKILWKMRISCVSYWHLLPDSRGFWKCWVACTYQNNCRSGGRLSFSSFELTWKHLRRGSSRSISWTGGEWFDRTGHTFNRAFQASRRSRGLAGRCWRLRRYPEWRRTCCLLKRAFWRTSPGSPCPPRSSRVWTTADKRYARTRSRRNWSYSPGNSGCTAESHCHEWLSK